jgi:hypothetical protein
MLRKIAFSFTGVFLLLAVFFTLAFAQQEEEYRLNIQRTFGFSSGSQIRGNFRLDVVGSPNIKSVTFMIDDTIMNQVTTIPFTYSFQTGQYAEGWHDLSAVIETINGQKISTPKRRLEFVSAEAESNSVVSIIVPLLGGVLLLMLIGVGSQILILRKRPMSTLPLGADRKYGLQGGGVCPQCHRPFSLHWWAPNMGLRTKFDRCDFCGKWSLIKVLNHGELAAAQAAELQESQPMQPIETKSEDNKLQELIDNSRYTDHT